ncbi:hypothetical protein DSAG12_02221 [Promethearchaeum syntrophicum]|uniref:FUZ/MON1/HPS1 first Longin domain-containing protein n=1 Tax=Promethearchaeum syntrophicum TaxID=2594042 RepID=A0A5B9DBJ1_9ARCH|nr:hypothetical protein [Candidatus Prometheoarchaeum syntrophicum]QEE16391.1 hypothetical protein DSAG12_02221 [Candidatus Prometheoarchaeum syntrophicum]
MALKLEELWIINKNGLPYLSAKSKDIGEGINPMIFSGFMSAVQNLAEDSIDAIKMRNSKIMIIPVKKPIPFFVIGRSKTKEKDSAIRKQLQKIRDMFLEEFSIIIEKWEGDLTFFTYFKNQLEEQFF